MQAIIIIIIIITIIIIIIMSRGQSSVEVMTKENYPSLILKKKQVKKNKILYC